MYLCNQLESNKNVVFLLFIKSKCLQICFKYFGCTLFTYNQTNTPFAILAAGARKDG